MKNKQQTATEILSPVELLKAKAASIVVVDLMNGILQNLPSLFGVLRVHLHLVFKWLYLEILLLSLIHLGGLSNGRNATIRDRSNRSNKSKPRDHNPELLRYTEMATRNRLRRREVRRKEDEEHEFVANKGKDDELDAMRPRNIPPSRKNTTATKEMAKIGKMREEEARVL